MPLDWTKYPNFSEAEMVCKCSCGTMTLTAEFMDRLQALRTDCGFPFAISSASRCPEHNQKVSTTGPTGPHTKGAVDILATGAQALVIIEKALRHGFTGIGVAQKGPHTSRFVHLDCLPNEPGQPRPWLWSY